MQAQLKSQPPASVENYTFDYSRSAGLMRWTLGDNSWLCHDIAGKATVIDVDGSKGRMTIACRLQIATQDDGSLIAYTWRK